MTRRAVFLPLSAALLIGMGIAAQVALVHRRAAAEPVVREGILTALGGLRSVAAEFVWFRADLLQSEGRYAEMVQLAALLTTLEPHVPEVWSYAAWNLAYNISIMMPTPEDRWRWVEAALRLLRDRGLVFNPESAALYRELAFLFEFKIGVDIDSAASLYRAEWAKIAAEAARTGDWAALRMDVARMRRVEARYGLHDWKSPFFSAVYWADAGLAFANKQDRAFLNEIIRQSCALEAKRLAPSEGSAPRPRDNRDA